MITLDHVAVMSRNPVALHAAYEALGFTLTPLAQQSGRLRADGPVEPWGTANRCAMFGRDGVGAGYLELIGVLDPALPGNGIERFLARYEGVHNITLGMADDAAELVRLRAAGLEIAGPLLLERPVDSADPHGPQARFVRLPLPDAPEGRLQLVRHLTPEAIWTPGFMAHANRAVALDTAIIVSAEPAATAARLSRLAGRPVVPDPAGGFLLTLAAGRVRVLWPEALAAVLPGIVAPTLPFIAGMVVRTADGAEAARGLSALTEVPGGWMATAGGAAVVFC